jgi:hypothetical protein
VKRLGYEEDDALPQGAVKVLGFSGVACRVLGWETEPDEDTHWSGYENRSGKLLVGMVGDDRRHAVDPEDVEEINREDYCGVCGQMGCSHDGYEREED